MYKRYWNKIYNHDRNSEEENKQLRRHHTYSLWIEHIDLYEILKPSLNQSCGSGMFIPDPNFSIPDPGSRVKNISDPGSGSASKNLSIFLTQKIVSKLSEIWSRMFSPDPDLHFLPIPDPGSRGQKGTGSRIRIRTTALNMHWIIHKKSWVIKNHQLLIPTETSNSEYKHISRMFLIKNILENTISAI